MTKNQLIFKIQYKIHSISIKISLERLLLNLSRNLVHFHQKMSKKWLNQILTFQCGFIKTVNFEKNGKIVYFNSDVDETFKKDFLIWNYTFSNWINFLILIKFVLFVLVSYEEPVWETRFWDFLRFLRLHSVGTLSILYLRGHYYHINNILSRISVSILLCPHAKIAKKSLKSLNFLSKMA